MHWSNLENILQTNQQINQNKPTKQTSKNKTEVGNIVHGFKEIELQNVNLMDDLKCWNMITTSLWLAVYKAVKNRDTAVQNLYLMKGL